MVNDSALEQTVLDIKYFLKWSNNVARKCTTFPIFVIRIDIQVEANTTIWAGWSYAIYAILKQA